MESLQYQFRLADVLLLPLVALAAYGTNSTINYMLYDVERISIDIWYDTVQHAFPTSLTPFFEILAIRSVDMTISFAVAIGLVLAGRRTHSAAVLLLLTLPISPQIGYDSSILYLDVAIERCPELLMVAVAALVACVVAIRAADCLSSKNQLLLLLVFFAIGAMGWWRFNPANYGDSIEMLTKANHVGIHQTQEPLLLPTPS